MDRQTMKSPTLVFDEDENFQSAAPATEALKQWLACSSSTKNSKKQKQGRCSMEAKFLTLCLDDMKIKEQQQQHPEHLSTGPLHADTDTQEETSGFPSIEWDSEEETNGSPTVETSHFFMTHEIVDALVEPLKQRKRHRSSPVIISHSKSRKSNLSSILCDAAATAASSAPKLYRTYPFCFPHASTAQQEQQEQHQDSRDYYYQDETSVSETSSSSGNSSCCSWGHFVEASNNSPDSSSSPLPCRTTTLPSSKRRRGSKRPCLASYGSMRPAALSPPPLTVLKC